MNLFKDWVQKPTGPKGTLYEYELDYETGDSWTVYPLFKYLFRRLHRQYYCVTLCLYSVHLTNLVNAMCSRGGYKGCEWFRWDLLCLSMGYQDLFVTSDNLEPARNPFNSTIRLFRIWDPPPGIRIWDHQLRNPLWKTNIDICRFCIDTKREKKITTKKAKKKISYFQYWSVQ